MLDVQFGPDGLVPVIAQDVASGQVLMVATMNAQALAKTVQSGEAWYWSRTRRALWRKGESSGNTQTVKEIRVDCDGDAVLLLVEQQGPACHTGHESCFFRDLEGRDVRARPTGGDVLDDLFALLKHRHAEMPPGSYTAALLRAGRERIGEKVREEAEELTRAAREESDRRVVEEAADLVYHTLVLLMDRDTDLNEVRRELVRRQHGS